MQSSGLTSGIADRPATIIDRISIWTGAISGWLLIGAAFAIGWEIFTRAFLGQATVWVYDITTYSLIWFTFLSGAYVLLSRRHLAVDLYVQSVAAPTARLLAFLGLLVIAGVTALLFWSSLDVMLQAYRIHELEPTILQTPSWLIVLGMVAGLAITLLQTAIELVRAGGQVVADLRDAAGLASRAANLALFLGLGAFGFWLVISDHVLLGLALLLVTFLFFGVPVFASLALAGAAALYAIFGSGLAATQVQQIAFKAVESNSLLAVPLYILAGNILQAGRVGPELYRFASVWVGHVRGGHAIATVVACGIFAAISGSSVATAATIGVMAIPEMLRLGYSERFVYGLVAAGGTLGILIPPSTPMILYSGITDESTGAMFMGGVVPGVLALGIFCIYATIASGPNTQPAAGWPERWQTTRQAIWGLLAPVIVLAGIYSGIFTPTEAAAVVVLYALAVSLLRGTVTFRALPAILADGVLVGGMIMAIIYGALILGTVTTLLQVPQELQSAIETLAIPPWAVFVIVMLFYLALGVFLEVVSIIMITVPIIYPLMTSLGFNGLWFGIVLVVLMELALITPPVGMNLFTVQGVTGAPLRRIIAGAMPFILLMFALLALLVAYPPLITWLPGTMGYKF